MTTVNENCHLQITPLQYIDVCVNDVQCKGLIDSGAQITVLSQQVFDKLKPDVCGYVNIQGIVGDVIPAPLVNVNIKSNEGQSYVNVGEGLQVTCAIASLTNVEHDVVLPVDIVNDIQRLPTISVLTCTVMSNDSDIKVNDTNEGHLTLDDCQTIIDVDVAPN